MEDIKSMNIYQRMALITEELQTVAKNLYIETGNGRGYKAVSERDVIDAVKPLEAKYRVFSWPVKRDTVDSAILESESEYKGKVTKRTTFYTRLKTTYRFVNIDKPEEYIDTETYSVGIDSQDKGDGKAMTYGDKYALMKEYKLSTGDDPDQEASKEEHYTTTRTKAKEEPPIKSGDDFSKQITDKQLKKILYEIERTGNNIPAIASHYEVERLEDLTRLQASSCIRTLEARPDMPPRAPEDPQIDMSVAEAEELPFK